MKFYNNKFTLLSEEQVFGDKIIDVINKTDGKCAITDFAILLGGYVSEDYYAVGDKTLKGRTGWWYLSSSNGEGDILDVNMDGEHSCTRACHATGGIRPILPLSSNLDTFLDKARINDLLEIEYGEYPQYVVESKLAEILETNFSLGILKNTGKGYTTNLRKIYEDGLPFCPKEYEEYEHSGKKYIRLIGYDGNFFNMLSDGSRIQMLKSYWVEVSPLKWFVDEKAKLLVSKNLIASGIRFCDETKYHGDFENTEMYEFLNTYFAKDIIPSNVKEMTQEKRNPYGFDFSKASEEDIIKGAIESNISVFLHGPSSEGKSARVKQIDPDCIIIYLRNATPESLNGKSVYNSEKGEMIDIKPSWLKKLEEKCQNEPDKLHIVFFDEITNALPSIQGIAFNIVLDKEVNGIWKLPENARIVAAGNEMKDSLSANQLAEPLFNRFAHVYIKTTLDNWLKWASENNIHPAIYSYIAYKKGETLRSKYDGEKPNADPRKWEMASNMLYKTGRPEMLRSLVGEDITREFIRFCNQRVITLEDVLNDNYTNEDIESLNTSERYATVMTLSQVDEDNLDKVIKFVTKLGNELTKVFYSLWAHGDDVRLEKILETELKIQQEDSKLISKLPKKVFKI